MVVLAAGTDGSDGPTDAAGAIVDGRSAARARAMGLDPRARLEDNDSHALLGSIGDLATTGPTNTNLLDLYLILIAERPGWGSGLAPPPDPPTAPTMSKACNGAPPILVWPEHAFVLLLSPSEGINCLDRGPARARFPGAPDPGNIVSRSVISRRCAVGAPVMGCCHGRVRR